MSAQSTVRTLDKGAMSSVEDSRQIVARTPAEFMALWNAHGAGRPLPEVNFAAELVAAVFLGSKPTAGHEVEIVETEKRGTSLIIKYKVTVPPGDVVTAQVLTSPYHIAAIPKAAGEIRFERQ